MQTPDYLDALRKKYALTSDAAVQRLLGVSDSGIRNYRTKRSTFDCVTARKVAALLELDPGGVFLDMQAQKARGVEERRIWEQLAGRVKRRAAKHLTPV